MSAAILIASLFARTSGELLIRVILVSLLLFFGADFIYIANNSVLDLSTVLTTVFVDSLASIILGFSFVGTAVLADQFSALVMAGKNQPLLTAASTAVAALAILVSSHFVMRTLFQPLSQQIDVQLEATSHGYIFTTDSKTGRVDKDPGNTRPFSFLRELPNSGSLNWRIPDPDFKVKWRATVEKITYDASIALFGGCWDPKNSDAKPVTIEGITKLDLWADSGMLNFKVYPTTSEGTVSFSHGRVASFTDTQSSDKGRINIQQLVQGRGVATILDDNFEFYAGIVPSDVKEDRLVARDGVLHIITDKGVQRLGITPSHQENANKVVACHAFDTTAALKDVTESSLSADLLGVSVKLRPSKGASSVLGNTGQIVAEGSGGFLIAEDVLAEDLLQSSGEGTVESFIAGANVKSLSVGGSSIEVSSSDFLFGTGNFRASFTNEGGIRYTGLAKTLTRNNDRLNLTRWETLSDEMHIAILSGTCVYLLGVIAFLVRVMIGSPRLPLLER